MSRMNQWYLVGDGIAREVISADIQLYLGPDALVRPGTGVGEYKDRPGYWITAYRTVSSQMIQDMKFDSQRWQAEKDRDQRSHGGGVAYLDSKTHAFRQLSGQSEGSAQSARRARRSHSSLTDAWDRSPYTHTSQPSDITPRTVPFLGENRPSQSDAYAKNGYARPPSSSTHPNYPNGDPYGRIAGTPFWHDRPTQSDPYAKYGQPPSSSTNPYYPNGFYFSDTRHMEPFWHDEIHRLQNHEPRFPGLETEPVHRPSSPSTSSTAQRHKMDIDLSPPQPYSFRNMIHTSSEIAYPPLEPLLSDEAVSAIELVHFERSQVLLHENIERLDRSAETIAYDCRWQVGRERFLEGGSGTTLKSLRPLGTGGAGVVDEVATTPGSGSLARKRIRISTSKRIRENELAYVRKEIDNLKRACHPHIVKIIGSYREESTHRELDAFILTYPVGQDLYTFLLEHKEARDDIEEGRLRQLWMKKWFGCLASALEYLHQERIQHNDIKPKNVIHHEGNIYFTDFNSSRYFESGHTSTETPARATRLYWAPEQAPEHESLKRHGNESDIFALGLVYVEMLTVLVGLDVNALHEFVDDHNGFGDSIAQKEYWRVIDRFDAWFASGEARRMYTACVKPMLAEERKSRPCAKEVTRTILERQPWRKTLACPCRDRLQTSG